MAQLNSSNVSNGNIVQSNDILQLYDAFTAGGGTTGVYNVSISGSLTGSATSASYALSSSYALTALSSSFAVSSSRAVTSSFASTANSSIDSTNTVNLLSPSVQPSGSNPISNYLQVAAGSITMTGSLATTAVSDALKAKTLGTTLFINATIFNTSTPGNIVSVRSYNPSTGQIQLQTASGSGTEFVMWAAFYVPA